MPRVKPERKNERRAQIIAAARICFARFGFHNATLHDVFAEAGLSAGCVYNYFQSKDELMLAIAKERHDDERRWIAEASDWDDPVAALRQVAKTFADEYLTEEGLEKRRIALQTWSEAQINPAMLSSVREGLDGPRIQLAQLIRRAQAAKQLTSKLDADSIAHTLIALFYGSVLQKLWKPDIDSDAHFSVFEHFLRSLEQQTTRSNSSSKTKRSSYTRASNR
jgi:TetR/AcrR family transcriptional regulator, repressor for uid operon